MSEEMKLEVFGALIFGYAAACKDLKIIAGEKAGELINGVEVNKWYPFQRFKDIEDVVKANYKIPGPILEKSGAEMMISWYKMGPGKEIVKKGVDFLKFQSSSQGYQSVVRGPKELMGSFELVELDEKEGKALVHSTTAQNKDMERGVIIGGMTAPGDLSYIEVKNDEDENYFKIKFG